MPKKCILLLLDGLGDRSFEELSFQTPLQAARTPVLDSIAASGASGLYHAAAIGQALPSENAHFAMFGYDLSEFPGRGALEALGAGIALKPDDVAVLAHFAGLREERNFLFLGKGKPKASGKELEILLKAAGEYDEDGVNISFTYTHKLHGILTLCGDVSPYITDSDPITEGLALIDVKPWQDYDTDRAARRTAKALKAYLIRIYHKLKNHPFNESRLKKGFAPINGMVTQRAGRLKVVTPFARRFGLRGLSIASGLVYHGLSKFVGLDYRKVEDTRDPGKDLADRLAMACEALDAYNFIHIHTKAPDEAAHTKDPKVKKEVIEALDSGIGQAIAPILENPDVFLVVAADHSTPSSGPLIHSGETVALTFYGRGVRRDAVRQFDEVSAAHGALGTVRGRELMYLVLNHLERAKLLGLMDTPEDQPYWPGNYEPFRLG